MSDNKYSVYGIFGGVSLFKSKDIDEYKFIQGYQQEIYIEVDVSVTSKVMLFGKPLSKLSILSLQYFLGSGIVGTGFITKFAFGVGLGMSPQIHLSLIFRWGSETL